MRQPRRVYDEEFMRNAVELSLKEGHSVISVSRDLGMPEKTLKNWRARNKQQVQGALKFTAPCDLQQQVVELQRKLEHVELQRDILKKALAICSSESEPARFTQ